MQGIHKLLMNLNGHNFLNFQMVLYFKIGNYVLDLLCRMTGKTKQKVQHQVIWPCSVKFICVFNTDTEFSTVFLVTHIQILNACGIEA